MTSQLHLSDKDFIKKMKRFYFYQFFSIHTDASKSKGIFSQWTVMITCSFQQKAHIDSISANWCIIVILMSALTFRPFYQMRGDVSAALLITVITFRHTISKQPNGSELIDPLLFMYTESVESSTLLFHFWIQYHQIDEIRLAEAPLIHRRQCPILYLHGQRRTSQVN